MGTAIGLRRNIAFCGHSDAGKTTLLDQILLASGAASGQHSVDDGTSICDFDSEEKLHHHTIETKVVHAAHLHFQLNLLDTPGYPDFIGQTIEALNAADCAAICVNATAGIEVNTRRVFREAERVGIGRMIIITRLDGDNIDFQHLWRSIQATFGPACALVNAPIGIGNSLQKVLPVLSNFDWIAESNGQVGSEIKGRTNEAFIQELRDALIERIVEADDGLMTEFFEGKIPEDFVLREAAAKAVHQGTLIPVFCTAAKSKIGVEELIDGMVWTVPSPEQVLRYALDEEGNRMPIEPSPDGPLVARVFKNRIDPYVQKLSFIRIFSGSLSKDQSVHISGQRKDLRMTPILDVQASQTYTIDHGEAGEIIAVAKMEELHIGTTLGNYSLPEMQFPTPMVGLAVAPKGHSDENKLFYALHKLVEEDPTLRVERDTQTAQLVMTGMSELHLSLVRERLQHRDKLEIEVSDPKIPLRETVQASNEGSYRHKKQSGGRGQFAEVHLRVFPLPSGTAIESFATKERFPQMKQHRYHAENNFLWVDSVVGGSIPGNFLPAIEKGVLERMTKGIMAGYPVQDICVEVFYGKHHPVDSSEAAFRIAGSNAFRDTFIHSAPCLLEPIVRMQVTVPETCIGDLYGDISARGGRVQGSEACGGGMHCVHCESPLRSVQQFGRVLSNLSGGQGTFTMEASHYEIMPFNLQSEYRSKSRVQENGEE